MFLNNQWINEENKGIDKYLETTENKSTMLQDSRLKGSDSMVK